MRINKFEHSAFTVEEGRHTLVVDPGSLTTPITGVYGVQAIVITHEHADHWTPAQLQRLLEANPSARLFGPAGVAAAASEFAVETVAAGDTVDVGAFHLRFFGGQHAVIHLSIPIVDNLGVLINDVIYTPGDSLTVPDGVAVDTLAVPASAPWVKMSEIMDFVTEVAPKRAFPTHDGLLSAAGLGLSNDRIKAVTTAAGGEYYPLIAGESLDV